MATETLIVELDADVGPYNRKMGRAADQTNKTSKSTSVLTKAVIALAAAVSVRAFAKYADTWKSIQNQLRVVTKDTDDLANTTENLLKIAQETGASIEATSTLYSRMARSTKDLNITQKDLLDTTEIINKAFVLSGATAEETTAAITQLSQGLASGALRGDEFNSVAEQAPVIMDAVAKGMGVTRGELRELAAQGAITSEVLIDSLLGYKDTVDTQFATASITLSRGFEAVENSTIQFIGELDNALGITDAVAGAMLDMSMDTNANADSARAFAATIKALGASWSSTFSQMSGESRDFSIEMEALKVSAGEVGDFLTDAFVNLPANIKASIEIAVAELLKFFDNLVSDIAIFSAEASMSLEGLLPEFAQREGEILRLEQIIEKEKELQEARKVAHNEFVDDILAKRDVAISSGQAVIEQENQEQEARKERREKNNEAAEGQDEIDEERMQRTADRAERLANRVSKADVKAAKIATKAKQKAADDAKKLEIQKLNQQQAGVRTGMALNTLLFEDNKAIAAGLIVADTATGIQKSLAINPYDYINVGLIAATGVINLSNALNASKGGGSITSSSGGGASISRGASDPETSNLDLTDQSESGITVTRLIIETADGETFMDGLAGSLEERQRRGR